MSKNIMTRVGMGVVGVLASAAMLFCVLPAQAATGWSALSTTEKKSSYGYFVWKSENATDANEKATAADAANILRNSALPTTKNIGGNGDATSLENMQNALDQIKNINKYRLTLVNEPCRTDLASGKGRVCDDANKKLTPYKVSDTFMATAQANANFSSTKVDHAGNNGQEFPGAKYLTSYMENAAWPTKLFDENGNSGAAVLWYSEKANYDKNPAWSSNTGHYISLTNKYAYSGAPTYLELDITGLGVNSTAPAPYGSYGNKTVVQQYVPSSWGYRGYSEDVDSYASDFNAYVAKVNELGKKYTVTFNTNGGSAAATQTVDSGSAATAPTAPTKAGYTFGGWYSDAQLTKPYDFSTPVTGNITLYAKWDAVTITSLDNAGTVSTPAGVAPTLPKQVTAHYSDGSSKPVDVTWNPISKSDYATAGTSFTVKGTVNGTDIKAEVTVNVTDAVPQSAAVSPTTVSTIATHAPSLPQQATVTYSDGTTQQADVMWDPIDQSKYATENADGFDVNGTVTVGDKTFTVTVKVIVTARTIKSVTAPDDQTVESGIEPTYPATVDVTYNDGETGTANVTWTKLTKAEYGKRAGGEFTVKGTVDGYADGVSFKVTVKPATVKSVVASATTAQTVVDETPDLSGIKATVTYSNGDTETQAITWEKTTADQFKAEGATVPVKGTVIVNGKTYEFTVNVTVVAATVESVTGPSANPFVTVDSGTKPDLSNAQATVAWSNGTTTQEPVTWDEPDKADYTNRKGGTFTVNGTVTIAGTDYKVKVTYKVNPATAQKAEPTDGTTTITVPSGTDPTSKLPKTATVTWSNGDTTTNPITWHKTYAKADYSKREGNTFTVNGTVDPTVESAAAADSSKVIVAKAVEAATLPVAVTVKVTPATITKVADIPAVTTEAKVAPQLQTSVKTDWSNGETGVDTPITWDAIDASQYAKRGEFIVNGKATDAVTGATADVRVTVKVTAKAESADKLADVTVDSGTDPASALPKTVKVTYTDGATEDAAVTWDTTSYTKADYSKREGNTFAVKGKAAGLDVTVTVKVNPATVKSVDTTAVTIGTKVGVQPDLPKTATVTWTNGDVETVAITWPEIPADKLDQAGSFEIEGVVTAGGKDYTIKATVTVTENTVTSVERDVKVSTTEGTAPALPKTVKAHWSDGSTTDAAVVWGDVPAAKYAKTGTFQVKGVATVNGTDYEVTATVTVVPGTLKPSASQNTNTGANTLTTTGSNIAIIVIVIVLLVIAAVALFFLTKRKK